MHLMSHVRVLQGKRSMLALINENSPPCLNRETNETFVSLVIWMLVENFWLSVFWLQALSCNFLSEYVPKKKGRQSLVFISLHVQQEDSDLYSDTSCCYITQCNPMKCDRSWKMKKSPWDSHSWGIHLSVCIVAFQVKSELQKSQHLWCLLLLFKNQIET